MAVTRIVRFVGDATGYRVEADQPASGWVEAFVGMTDRVVRVNMDQAYCVEEWPGRGVRV